MATSSSMKRKQVPSDLVDESDSDSSSMSSSAGSCRKIVRHPACDATMQNVAKLGIFYSECPKSLSEMFDILKARKRRVAVPDCMASFIRFTKETLRFSLDGINWNKNFRMTLQCERDAVESIEAAQKNLLDFAEQLEMENDFLQDRLQKRLFTDWFTSVFRFLSETKEVLVKLNVPAGITSSSCTDPHTLQLKESLFTQLFLKFTEMFFLQSEVSDNSKKDLKIKKKAVGSIPDIRFYEHEHSGHWTRLLAMLIELKKDATTAPADQNAEVQKTWIGQRLNAQVLSQIGMELVRESCNSTFSPDTFGIICMRTQIILVYLEMTSDHWEAIQRNKDLEGKRANIHYSEIINIMNANDRDQMVEIFFWLGCLQKQNLHRYYLLQ